MIFVIGGKSGTMMIRVRIDVRKRMSAVRPLDRREEPNLLVAVSFCRLGSLPFLEVEMGASGSSLGNLPFWEVDTESRAYRFSNVSANSVPLRSPL